MDTPNSQQTPTSAHSSLLRDEVLVMRVLFGYLHEDIVQTPSLPQSLPASLGNTLPGSAIRDVLFVALDDDTKDSYQTLNFDKDFHIGISILSLQDCIIAATSEKIETAIRSYQFSIGYSKYIRKAAKKFLFGNVELIRLADLKSRFKSFIVGRQMVLVFHGGSASDWKIFQSLQLDQQPLFVLDTVTAAQHPLRLSYRWSLEKLPETFCIPLKLCMLLETMLTSAYELC